MEDLDAGSLRLSTCDCALNMRIAKRISGFRSYTRQEEADERFLGVSTKLKLWLNGNESNDPWKIKKNLRQSDCDHLYRLMPLLESSEWRRVWDYEREKEYELKLKKLSSSKSYVVSGAWRTKFVKERRLKKGDTIGLYWSTSKSRFVFSVLARAPPAPLSEIWYYRLSRYIIVWIYICMKYKVQLFIQVNK